MGQRVAQDGSSMNTAYTQYTVTIDCHVNRTDKALPVDKTGDILKSAPRMKSSSRLCAPSDMGTQFNYSCLSCIDSARAYPVTGLALWTWTAFAFWRRPTARNWCRSARRALCTSSIRPEAVKQSGKLNCCFHVARRACMQSAHQSAL